MSLNQSLVGSRRPALTSTVTAAELEALGAALAAARPAAAPASSVAHDAAVLVGLGRAAAAIGPVLLDPLLGADMMRLGQIAHAFRVVRPVTAGDVVQTTAGIAGIVPTDAGERLDLQITSTNAAGEVVVDGTAGVLLRGPRRRQHDGEPPDTEAQVWSPATTFSFNAAAIGHFCTAVSEHNPVYVDDDAAHQAGLPTRLVPNGALVAAVWRALGTGLPAISANYLRPALVDEMLTIETRDGGHLFRVVNQVGVVLLDGTIGGAS